METKHLQILKPFARTCSKRSTMPILDYLFVENNVLTATDLETWLTIPVQLPNGMYTIINNEFFKQEAKAEDFPLYPELDKEYKKTQQLTLTPGYDASPKALANITASTANDELRPVMNGVFFDNENMVASDAHVLRMVPVNENQKAAEINFISPVPQVLVSMLRKYSDSHVTVTKYEHKEKTYKGGYITYEFPEGVTIAVREVEGLYPNYKSVCPKVEKYKRAVSLSTTQAAEIIKFTKAIDKEAGRIYFNETTPSAKNQDLTVEKVFDPVNTDNIPDRQYDGLIMPMMPGEKDKGSTENLFIINASRFEAITKGHRGKITLAVEDCSRAILVWLTPANQKAASRKPAPKAVIPAKAVTSTQKHDIPATPQPQKRHDTASTATQPYTKRIIWQAA